MQNDSFNLVQAVTVWQKRWKTMFLFVVLTVVVATVTVFVVPPYYKSVSLIVSANTFLTDKARLFNNQVQQLYSFFGSGDDLDRLNGVAEMDTTYLQLVDEFSLINYYQINGSSLPILRRKAVLYLRKDIAILRTEQAQLKITCWTKDPQLSAQIANRMVAIIQEKESAIWKKNYQESMKYLDESVEKMGKEYRLTGDSLLHSTGTEHELASAKMQTLLEQIRQYKKTADEFRMAASNLPPALYVMETATPAAYAERPDKALVIFTSFLVALAFSSIWVLIADRKGQA